MTISAHLAELQRKHEVLSRRVQDEQKSPGADSLDIVELKKQKLRLKEEITRLAS